tara:strand:+ start:106 stop:471 length:366 start_codon:yes stop_codon:yes gene_type:complete
MSCFRVNNKSNKNELSICIKKKDIINNNYNKHIEKQLKCNNKKIIKNKNIYIKNIISETNNEQDNKIIDNLYGIDECIICISDTINTDELCILKCNHTYHKICIDKWFLKQKTCPICMITI